MSRHTSVPSCAGRLEHGVREIAEEVPAPPSEGPGCKLATPGTTEAGIRYLAQAHLLAEEVLLVVVLKVSEDAQYTID